MVSLIPHLLLDLNSASHVKCLLHDCCCCCCCCCWRGCCCACRRGPRSDCLLEGCGRRALFNATNLINRASWLGGIVVPSLVLKMGSSLSVFGWSSRVAPAYSRPNLAASTRPSRSISLGCFSVSWAFLLLSELSSASLCSAVIGVSSSSGPGVKCILWRMFSTCPISWGPCCCCCCSSSVFLRLPQQNIFERNARSGLQTAYHACEIMVNRS